MFHRYRRSSSGRTLWAAVSVAMAGAVAAQAAPLNLSHDHLIFDDEFNRLSVSADGTGTTWSAHTPWHGDFGDAAFIDPRPGFPFTVKDGILQIELGKRDGRWASGLLSSTAPDRAGFSARYGYFEMRAKLPPGPGVWPAFWLDSRPPEGSGDPSIEVDIVEQYGQFPGAFNSTVTVWWPHDTARNTSRRHINLVPAGTMSEGFHTYGADVEPDWIVFYFDRNEVWRTPTPPEHRHGLGILLDLGLGGGWPTARTPDPSFLFVDYVRVYQR